MFLTLELSHGLLEFAGQVAVFVQAGPAGAGGFRVEDVLAFRDQRLEARDVRGVDPG